LFKSYEVERLIELGPAAVLSRMATNTLKVKYEAYDDAVTRRRVQFCSAKDSKDIYYEFEDIPVEETTSAEAIPASSPASAPVAAPVAPTPSSRRAGPISYVLCPEYVN
jgi:fatty acid synthase subunit alpha, fungi type